MPIPRQKEGYRCPFLTDPEDSCLMKRAHPLSTTQLYDLSNLEKLILVGKRVLLAVRKTECKCPTQDQLRVS